jgi:hypothetical protein
VVVDTVGASNSSRAPEKRWGMERKGIKLGAKQAHR